VSIPFREAVKVGSHLVKNKIRRRDKFALVLELEPLFACNLACSGCGKIQHPASTLKQRMSVEDAVKAVDDCGAPVVSIAGGEPLMHPQMPEMVQALLDKKRCVYLCTNALLLRKKLHLFKPHPNFAWVIHIDGLEDRHDESVDKAGTFTEAVEAVRAAKAAGFRVNTNTTFFNTDTPHTVREVLDYLNDDLQVDRMMISPGYAYEKAPDQDHFLGVRQTQELFQKAFDGKRKHWRLNHSPMFLDFLEGKFDFDCTAWAIPSYSVFGWQRPCYLMGDSYASSYKELLETTDWDKYGRGKDPRCANCMAHCGYEPSAVLATMGSLKQSLRAITS
jgi:hopanoid biosynthesis associated radical SAM protein HpnH